MKGTLAWFIYIRMALFKGKQLTTVLQDETKSRRTHAGTKSTVIGLDQ